jgi:hypothetical protein
MNTTTNTGAASLSDEEKSEILDWVSACQSAYHIDSTPGHRFGGLGSNLEDNRAELIACVEGIMSRRAATTPQADAAPSSKLGADMTDEQLSDANKQACEWTDDWSERQEKEPSKEQSDAMFVRKLTELLAPVAIDKEVKTNDQERPGRVNDAAGRNRSLSGISIENAPQLSEGQQALSFAIGRLHIAASPLTHSANVAGLIQEAIDRLNWLGANPELLAR